jgi:GNAT superfamily N-acetyltransferase
MLKVVQVTEQDIPAWLDLADEVAPLFGADMANDPTFQKWLERSVERGSAYCVRIDGELAGAMEFRNGWVNWLAVRRQFQRQGVGQAMVEFAQASGAGEIRVATFGIGHPHRDATSGREFYQALGFDLSSEIPKPAADGTPREILVWRAK